jgi:hypothetical protein
MNIKRIATGLLTAMALSWTTAVYADNLTEFGIEDDLTVLGTAGTAVDPDLEIKGFSVFGTTQAAPALQIPQAPGNMFVNGYVQVSSGMYVTGGSTFTSTVNLPGPTSLFITGGTEGQILTKNATTGALRWDSISSYVSGDNLGNHVATTTLNMMTFNVQNAGYITASSAALSGQLIVLGTSTLTGNTGVAGTLTSGGLVTASNGLSVTGGNSTLTNNLTVNGNSQLGDGLADIHGVNTAAETGTALKIAGEGTTGKFVAKFYSGDPAVATNLAAWIKKK